MAHLFRAACFAFFFVVLSACVPSAGNAATFAELNGLWEFSSSETAAYLASIKHPDAEAISQSPEPDGTVSLRLDAAYGAVVLYENQRKRSFPPFALKSQSSKGKVLTLKTVSTRRGDPYEFTLTVLDKNRIVYTPHKTPVVLVKKPARQAVKAPVLRPLTGEWVLDIKEDLFVRRIRIAPKATIYSDGYIKITARIPVKGKDTDVTRTIPFSVTAISAKSATLRIYPAPPFVADNGGGGSSTVLIEECDLIVVFTGPKTMTVQIPSLPQPIPLKRK